MSAIEALAAWVAIGAIGMGMDVRAAGTSTAADSCAVGAPLPAYAHNDYANRHPLYDALSLGYQGVEADFHLVRGRLLVAHDLRDVRSDRTLEALYLRPLLAWVERCGYGLPDHPLLFNIEAKTEGYDAYHVLVRLLRTYHEILTVVRDGEEVVGPVQVVLVGWHPPLDSLVADRERFVAVQWDITDPASQVPSVPPHLIRLITVDYGKAIGWSGRGLRPAVADSVLTRLIRERDVVPGRLARVHNVPTRASVYRMLLDAGIDLIGTKDLTTSRDMLTERQ